MVSIDWKSDLRQRGYRLTPQRQLVLEAVDTLEHATPDDILVEVRRTASAVNISTVYRTLELLEELGLVSHAHLGHGAPTYHLAARHHHLHLVCRDCSEVIEAETAVATEFTAKLRAEFGFDTDLKHFAIFGRCARCSATREKDQASSEAAGAGGDGGRARAVPAADAES
ncbi:MULTISPECIES: Fur family transcriptional regulator [Streptomyces]|uniref:Nickel uptake regulation protein NUR n=1 Tax=Streptomyces albus (strain ATCC 21838 / DSM 41398 / FERM P-419 / JCM 4703 / NBRC 107858) TaxID=1081613 RepID=A0A0B5F2B4_STRA4|nr:transcriptional repressor [Streptomyces sp. SCSIO ZS0520]AJE84452.1 Nickel uptake regulation protein NUR [Streptomyces albus]AOU78763.1 Nickel uptake regulation protein NUR or Ferric uptake regulation protein FUR [Streptomyces albus]AYN34497.1 Fur family transcriptional regulator [Streptomyces albus]